LQASTIRNVLIVDDHEYNHVYLEHLLACPAIRLLHARNGQEALAIAEAERPDLVLTDVCMPKMDGLELCDAIRHNPALASTRVILLSAVVGEDTLSDSADELGANGYFAKPFNEDAVRRGVDQVLGGVGLGARVARTR
jgi:CheY-like chemotaxis protein